MPESVVHFQIRMPPQQHEKLATWAKEDKVSLNLLVVGILEKAMENHKSEACNFQVQPALRPKATAWSLVIKSSREAGLMLGRP